VGGARWRALMLSGVAMCRGAKRAKSRVESIRIRRAINKRKELKAENKKTKHQRKIRRKTKKEEDWIGIIHSINRITRKSRYKDSNGV